MAIDMTPEQKEIGKANFQRVVGRMAEPTPGKGVNRRQFMKGLVAAGAAVPVSAALYFSYSNEKFRDRPVRAALIGAGDEGGVLVGEHNPAYLEFVAYSDIRPSNQKRIFTGEPTGPRRGFNYHYGNDAVKKIAFFEDFRKLLADNKLDIEAVVIALPLHLHAPVAIEAMQAGKHVLCEKLMAWNVAQCKDMIRCQDEMSSKHKKDLLLSIGHQRHYSMLYSEAVEVIRSGVLGDIQHIRALWHRNNASPIPEFVDETNKYDPKTGSLNYKRDPRTDDILYKFVPKTNKLAYKDSWRPEVPKVDKVLERRIQELGYDSLEQLIRWRLYMQTGGGLMAELGSHQLDACSIFLGKVRPLAVSAIGGKYFYDDDREIEDHVFCTFEFPGKNYNPNRHPGDKDRNDIVVVTYSSISTNSFEPYGECVMGSKGIMVVEMEQNVMLWGGAGRSTSVTVKNASSSKPALEASASTEPMERKAVETGKGSLGTGTISRGYREEMEHFAYCIRTREQGYDRERQDLKPRCDGHGAMADAIIALTANQAMRGNKKNGFQPQRIVFEKDWYNVQSNKVPDANMKPKKS